MSTPLPLWIEVSSRCCWSKRRARADRSHRTVSLRRFFRGCTRRRWRHAVGRVRDARVDHTFLGARTAARAVPTADQRAARITSPVTTVLLARAALPRPRTSADVPPPLASEGTAARARLAPARQRCTGPRPAARALPFSIDVSSGGAGGSPVTARISSSFSVSRASSASASASSCVRCCASSRFASSWLSPMIRAPPRRSTCAVCSLNGFDAAVALRSAQVRVLARRELHHADPLAHAPARDHAPRERGRLLDVALGAGRLRAVDDFLGGAPAQHADDPRAQIRFGIVVAVAVGPLVGHAERLPARHDRHAVHGIGARQRRGRGSRGRLRGTRCARDRRASAGSGAPGRARSSRAHRESRPAARCPASRRAASSAASLTRFLSSAPEKPGVAAASSPRLASAASGTLRVCTLRIASRPVAVGQVDDDAPVEAARAAAARGRARRAGWSRASTMMPSRLEKPSISVRIWLSVCSCSRRPADRHRPARATDRVELVDEDDRRRVLARLLEQVAHARGADADDHLDELGGAHREERHARLARDRLGEQRLARARRADRAARPWARCRRAACTSAGRAGSRRSRRARSRPRRCRRRRRT